MGTKTKSPPKPAKPGRSKPAAPDVGAPAPPPAPQPAGLVAPPLPPVEYRGTLPLARLKPSPTNPRKTFDPASVAELAASVGSLGLLQPLLVRPVGPAPRMGPRGWEGVDHFEVVAGARRLRALELNGAAEAAVTCRLLSDAEVAWVQLVENDQREDVRPSERAAAYAALAAAGQTAEQISAATGVALSAVRDLVRLARLPAWALAAVDAGTLPLSTAAIVAKVPGEESRKRAAGCALLGIAEPRDLENVFHSLENCYEELSRFRESRTPLSYRGAKELVGTHFTRQLKGAPFSLKLADLVPAAGSCDACPKRAGNDPDARADGVRADVCLDPDCYREKVAAHDAAELLKGTRKGYVSVPEDFTWPTLSESPPRGWCDVDAPAQVGDLSADLQGTKHGPTKLRELLRLDGHAPGGGPLVYAALDLKHKLRAVMRTADVRKLLTSAGVLKKPERAKPKAEKPAPKPDAPAAAGKPLVAQVSAWEADERAAVIAAGVLREYAEDQCSALAELPDAAAGGPVRGALELVARAFVYDVMTATQSYDTECVLDVLKARFPIADLTTYHLSTSDTVIDPALAQMTAPQLLALLLQLAAALELGNGPRRETGKDLLDWAELDWANLTDQARRELAGGPTADERLDAAEAAGAAAEPVDESPDRNTPEGALYRAIHSYEGAAARWAKVKAAGATDAELKEQIGEALGSEGGSYGPGKLDVQYKGGKNPAVWIGDVRRTEKPTLTGKALVDKVREVLGIPLPGAPADPAPPASVMLSDLDLPASVFDLLEARTLHTLSGTWATCQDETAELAALPPRNRLMAWLVKLGAKAKQADQAAEAIAAALPGDAGKAGAA